MCCSHFANAPAPRTPCSRSPELCYGNVYMPACWHCSFGPATTPSSARGPPTPRSGSQSWRPWTCAQRWKSGRPRRYRSTLIQLAWWAIECAHFLAWYYTIFEVLRRSHGAARTLLRFESFWLSTNLTVRALRARMSVSGRVADRRCRLPMSIARARSTTYQYVRP
jgi:hypothetical protein